MVLDGLVRALDGFEAVLAGVAPGHWSAPSPCAGWSAADVASHVIGNLRETEALARGHRTQTRTVAAGTAGLSGKPPASTGGTSLLFTSNSIQHAVSLRGRISVHLRACSSGTDANIYAEAWDVAPDGTASFLSDGALKASHRNTLTVSQPVTGWNCGCPQGLPITSCRPPAKTPRSPSAWAGRTRHISACP